MELETKNSYEINRTKITFHNPKDLSKKKHVFFYTPLQTKKRSTIQIGFEGRSIAERDQSKIPLKILQSIYVTSFFFNKNSVIFV